MEPIIERSKILIVDDNPHNVYSFQAILKAPEVEMLAATSGEEALQLLLEHPDMTLILMDVQMPGLDGFETTDLIRGQPKFRDIPVLFITAVYRSDEFARRGFRTGASDYITKPVDNDVLESKVNVFLTLQNQKKQLAREIEARTRAEAQANHLNSVLQAIRNVNQLIVREKDRTRLIQGACDCLIGTQGFASAWIALLDGDGRATLTAQAGLGEAFDPVAQKLARGELPPCGEEALQQAGAVVFEVSPDACPGCSIVTAYGPRTVLASRLEHEGRVYGLLAASFPTGIAANHQEQSLLAEVADDLAFALHSIEVAEARQKAEEALRDSEDRYRTLFETMAQGVVYQAVDGAILAANPAAERILGLTLDQMQGRTSFDPRWRSIHEDGSDFPGETHPAMVALQTGKPVRDVVMGVLNPLDDGYHWLNVNATPQFRPGEDRPYQVYTTFDDITRRKRAEDDLREHHEHLEQLVAVRTSELRNSEEKARAQYKGIPVPTYTWQKVGDGIVLVDYNDAAEAVTQGKIADLVGIELADMYRDTPEIREEIERCFAERISIEREMPYQFRSTGQERHLAVKYAFVPPDLVLVHTEDITERVHAEQAVKQQSAELRKMVNLMAGREVRMAELKDVIRKLRGQLAEAGLAPLADDPLQGP